VSLFIEKFEGDAQALENKFIRIQQGGGDEEGTWIKFNNIYVQLDKT
jgi:hypothetical protein